MMREAGRRLLGIGARARFAAYSLFEKKSSGDSEFTPGAEKYILKSPDGADVSGVRYLWKNDPLSEICVFDSGGLPLYPFENLKNRK